jgi:hypothetical protein
MKRGWNDIEIEVVVRNARISAPLCVDSIETIIRYRDGN